MQKSKRKNIILAGILSFILIFGMFSLAGCGEPPHEHNWAESYSHDAEQHWHACTGCDEKFGFTAHYFFDEHDAICDTCGYERSIGDHVAETDWAQNGTHHWHNCQHDGCTIKFDEANHIYDDDHDTTCGTCGYVRSVGDHGAASAWTSDATGHWHACTHGDCDYKYDFAAHTPDAHGFCSVCGEYAGTKIASFPRTNVELGTLEAGTHYFRVITNFPGTFTVTATNLPIASIEVYEKNHFYGWRQIFDGTSFYFSYYSDRVDDAHIYFVITLETQITDCYINFNFSANV